MEGGGVAVRGQTPCLSGGRGVGGHALGGRQSGGIQANQGCFLEDRKWVPLRIEREYSVPRHNFSEPRRSGQAKSREYFR